MKKIPVGATIAHGYRFAFGQAPTMFKAIWLPLLAQLALVYLLFRRTALFLAASQAQDPSAVTLVGPLLLLYPLMLIFFFAQLAAATETALGHPPQSWISFHFGKPMWRLLGGFLAALLAIMVIAAIALVLLVLVVTGFNMAVKAPSSDLIMLVTGLLGLVFLGMLIFVLIRFLFLLAPVNISQHQLGVGQAWHLSAGNFWRILLIALAILIPILIVNYAYTFSVTVFPPPPTNTSKETVRAWQTAWEIAELNGLAGHWYFTLPLLGLLLLFQFGAGCAAQVFAYRALTENDASAPVAGG